MTNTVKMNQIQRALAAVTLATGATLAPAPADATGSTTPPGSTTPTCTSGCTPVPPPVTPPPVTPPAPVAHITVTGAPATAAATANPVVSPTIAPVISPTIAPVVKAEGGTVQLAPGAIAPKADAAVNLAPGAIAPKADAAVNLAPGAIAPKAEAVNGPIDNKSKAEIGAGAGSSSVNIEGARRPSRLSVGLGLNLGNAQATPGDLPGVGVCGTATSNVRNYAGLYAKGDSLVINDQDCLQRIEALQTAQHRCDAAIATFQSAGNDTARSAFATRLVAAHCDAENALTAARNDFAACSGTTETPTHVMTKRVNAIGVCEETRTAKVLAPVAMPQIVAAPAHVPAAKAPAKKAKSAFTGCAVTVTTPNACTPKERQDARNAALGVLRPAK